ncbi:hypothetical protein BDW66DRAFT_125309 [Aspergillus desertorum]
MFVVSVSSGWVTLGRTLAYQWLESGSQRSPLTTVSAREFCHILEHNWMQALHGERIFRLCMLSCSL